MFHPDGPSFWELAEQALSSTRRGYDLLAPKFDRTPFRTPEPILEAVFRQLPRGLGAGLDLCCGTGAALPHLAKHCEHVVGVDFSPGMLDIAHDRCPEAELVVADIFDFDAWTSFDAITCFGAFGHVQPHEEEAFVDRVYRWLRPGGRFVFASAASPPLLSPSFLISKAFNAAMHLRNALVDPPFVMFYLTFMLPRCARLLERRGFEVVRQPASLPAPLARLEVVTARRPRAQPTR